MRDFSNHKVGDEVFVRSYKGMGGSLPYYRRAKITKIGKLHISVEGTDDKFDFSGSRAGAQRWSRGGDPWSPLLIVIDDDAQKLAFSTNAETTFQLAVRNIQKMPISVFEDNRDATLAFYLLLRKSDNKQSLTTK